MEIGLGLSKHRDAAVAVKEAFWQAKTEIGREKIDLALVFSSINLASPALLKTLHTYLPGTPIIGCSSLAIISHSNIYNNGVVLLLLSTKKIKLKVACVKDVRKKTAFVAGGELANNLLQGFPGLSRDLAIIFCDGLMEEGSKLILGMQQKLGTSFPIAGASASDDLKFNKTYLYFNQEILTDAVVGILWAGRLNFGLTLRHGWKPLGIPRVITQSKGNLIREIDHKLAANLYQDYFAKDILALRKELKYISTLYPLGLYLEGEEECLLRNIISIRDDGALVCQGDAPLGSRVRLMIGTKESCLAATRQAAQEVKKNFSLLSSGLLKQKPQIKIVFVFDSVSRYILLRRKANEELKIIQEEIGENIPVVGLYTYGEQGPLKAVTYKGKVHFHNQTIVIIVIGE